jgi:hypothetical protein
MCQAVCMTTTRRRVNLVLTESEEESLRRLTEDDSVHRRILEANQVHRSTRPLTAGRIDADLIHQVLAIGLHKLDQEAIAASYAAEAAEHDAVRAGAVAWLQRTHLGKADGASG